MKEREGGGEECEGKGDPITNEAGSASPAVHVHPEREESEGEVGKKAKFLGSEMKEFHRKARDLN